MGHTSQATAFGLLVAGKVCGPGEELATVLAAVGLLAAVRPQVPFQDGGREEGFPALLTRMGPLPTVALNVLPQVRRFPEPFPALLTRVGPLPAVRVSVLLDVCGSEPLPALLALIEPPSVVGQHVPLEVCQGHEAPATLVALVGSGPRVGLLVHTEVEPGLIGLPTDVTRGLGSGAGPAGLSRVWWGRWPLPFRILCGESLGGYGAFPTRLALGRFLSVGGAWAPLKV